MKAPRVLPILLVISFGLFAFLIAGYWQFSRYATDEVTKQDRRLQRGYKAIRHGMTRQEVVRLMGQPVGEGTEFHLSQYEGFEKEYERATNSGSKYYLFWRGGIDITYAVGFGTNDKVTMKAYGGS